MDLSQKIIAAILAGFFLVALIRVFSSPFRLALKLLLNTLLGFLALGAVRLTAGLTGIALGLNLWNALVIAVLGLPGFVLLLLSSGFCSITYVFSDARTVLHLGHQNTSPSGASPYPCLQTARWSGTAGRGWRRIRPGLRPPAAGPPSVFPIHSR